VVYLSGLINLRLVGDVIPEANTTSNVFAAIPDVPLSRFELKFPGGKNGLLFNSRNLCSAAVRLTGRFTSYAGKTATAASNANVQGCRRTPRGSASVTGLGSAAPGLTFSVTRGADENGLRSLKLTLPGGLSFNRARLRAGVRVRGGGKVSFSGARVLKVSGLSRKGVDAISAAVGNGALRASKSLRRGSKLKLTFRVTDAAGHSATLKKTVRGR
jgi:hypothetical protein